MEKTIKSVISQDFKNYEHIIIAGESTDNTNSIIRKYKKYLQHYVIEQDEGIYFAMNKGLDFCCGEFINFLNAGDTFTSRNTLKIVSNSIYDKTDIISGSINSINLSGNSIFKSWKNQYDPKQYMFCYHQTMFTKNEIFKDNKFNTSFKVCADYDWALRCLFAGFNFQFVNDALVNFQEGGFSDQNKIKARIEELFIQSNYFEASNDILDKNALTKLLMYKKSNNYMLPKLLQAVHLQLLDFNKNYSFSLYGFGTFGQYVYQSRLLRINNVFDNNYNNFIKNDFKILVKDPKTIVCNPKMKIIITALGHESEIENSLIYLGFDSHNIFKFKL